MEICKKHNNYGPFPCDGCEIDRLKAVVANLEEQLKQSVEARQLLACDLHRAKTHECECGIPRDPNELCEVRCHLLNLLPEDPLENEGLSAVELVEKIIKSERLT